MNRTSCTLLSSFLLTLCLCASETPEDVLSLGQRISFPSRVFRQAEHYIVSLPEDYEANRTPYPVLFVLNGHMPNRMALSTITVSELGYEFIPPMIVIGIDLNNKPTFPELKDGRIDAYDKIFTYLKDEIIPDVDKRYRTAPFRILFGQSNSATCATFLMLREPTLFNAYILASPMLGWCYDTIETRTRQMLNSWQGESLFYFMSYGENDYREYVNDFAPRYQHLFDVLPRPGIVCRSEQVPHQGHVPMAALSNGLHLLFQDYFFNGKQRMGSLKSVQNHYLALSERMGFAMPVPEAVLFDMGYLRYQARHNDEALLFFKEVLKKNPRHRNALRFVKAMEAESRKEDTNP